MIKLTFINIFDLISSLESKSLQWNWLKHARFQSTISKSIKEDQKYQLFNQKWLEMSIFIIFLINFVVLDGFWPLIDNLDLLIDIFDLSIDILIKNILNQLKKMKKLVKTNCIKTSSFNGNPISRSEIELDSRYWH